MYLKEETLVLLFTGLIFLCMAIFHKHLTSIAVKMPYPRPTIKEWLTFKFFRSWESKLGKDRATIKLRKWAKWEFVISLIFVNLAVFSVLSNFSSRTEVGLLEKNQELNSDEAVVVEEKICATSSGIKMTIFQAKEIAEKECLDGIVKDVYSCNDYTGTWWIDFEPNEPKEGCNPACVVDIEKKTAEINWRCTGLISE
jgi:hypothetical protein